ncbi:MAG: PAS domain S-box protein, partial [Fidelibacterota bacterium]
HWSLIIPEDQHPIVNAVDERRKQGESSVYDLQLVRKDGQRLDVRVSGSPRFQNSEFVGTMAVFTDITEQKRTDKALRESEEKFKSIFESFIDVYYRQDKDRLITMVSPSIRQFGYKPEDIIGTRGRDYYYDQAEREELVALLEKEGIIKDYRVKLRDARGNPVWTSANLRMLRDLKGNFAGIEGVLRDITKRKQAEEALRDSEERYRNILESIEEGYYEVDLKGNFTFFNDSLCKMLDYSRDELMGMNNRQYMDAESAKRVYKAFNEVYKTGKPSKTLDIRIRRNTGEIKFGEISITLLRDRNSKSVGFRGIVRDITERKQAEDQLRTSEDFNRTVLSSISEGFVVFDRDFHYVVWNHFMEIITGLKASEVIGKTPFDLFPFIKEHNLDKLLKRALKGEELISPDFQYSIPGTGREGWAISTYAPHRNSDGEIIGVVVLVRDITERKRAEEEIQRSAENLENLFRFTTDAIIIQNKKREILDCNRAVEELFGYTREELLQDQSIQLGDQNKVDLEKRDEVMQLAFDGQPQRFEWWGKRKDGTSFPEEILLNQTLYNGEKVLFITIRDITQQQQARDRIEQQAAQQQALLNIGRQLTASLDTNEIFNNMLESVRNLLNCNGVTIYMLEEDDQTLVPIMTYDPPFEKQVMKTKLDINHSLTGKVIKAKQGMIFNKPISEEGSFQIPGTPEDEDDRIISVPIVVKDRAVGAITIYRKATAFTKDDLALMETFALYSGTAIQNAENHQMVKEKENRLRQAEEVAGMGFLYWNLRTDEIELSPQVIKMYGLEAEKRWVTPEFVEQVCHPEDLHYVKEQLNSTLTEEQPYDIDYRIVRPDGSILWVHAQAELEKDKDGQPIRLLGTVIDITERKETEQALAKSEKQYRTMIETAPDIIITVDKTGYITNANPAFTKLTGWELDEILHKHFTKLPWFRAKDVPQFVKIFNTMVRGQLPEPFEIHLKHADGSIHISEARVSSLYSDQVLAGFQFILHDITERNVAHQVLEQQAKFQKAIAEISREAVITVTLEEFMNFTVSKVANTLDMEYCKILEFQPRENSFLLLAGFGWKPGYVGKARVGAEKSSQAGYTLLSKKPVIVEDLRTEKRFSGPKLLTAHNVISGVSTIIGDHSEPWGVLGVHSVEKHVMTPATVGFIVSIANILNEAIIRHQLESKFRNLVENSPTGILSVNANGQVMQVNQKLLDILGSPSAEETMKINVLEFEPLKKAGASDGFRKVLKTGETIRLEHEYTSKWGKTVYLRYQVVPIWDEHDQIVGAQANIEDITEEKRTRQEINTLANAIKSIHESVSVTDDKDRILFVNDAFLKTYGYVREEIIGKTMELVRSPKNPPEVTQEILPATLKGGWQGELLNRRKDGSEFPVALSTSPVLNEKGEVVALIGVA